MRKIGGGIGGGLGRVVDDLNRRIGDEKSLRRRSDVVVVAPHRTLLLGGGERSAFFGAKFRTCFGRVVLRESWRIQRR